MCTYLVHFYCTHVAQSEGNLLSTATLFLWDHSRRGYFTAITSHQRKGCEKVFNSPLKKKVTLQYVCDLVFTSHSAHQYNVIPSTSLPHLRYHSCSPFLLPPPPPRPLPAPSQLLTLLSLTQTLFAALSLWDSQVTAAGEVCLKLAYLLEYSAEDAKPNLEVRGPCSVDCNC